MNTANNENFKVTDKDCNVLGGVTLVGVQSQTVGHEKAYGYTLDTYGNTWFNIVKNYSRRYTDNTENTKSKYRFQKRRADNSLVTGPGYSPYNPVELYNRTDTNNADKLSRDFIKTNYLNKPVKIDGPDLDRIAEVSYTDYEFVFDNGVLMAREEGYDDQLEPEDLTPLFLNS